MGQVVAVDAHLPAITIPPVPSQTYLHHTTLNPRPILVLIGDSITEQGSSHPQGWVSSLAIRYNRRLDVVNRGMNGYNSRWGLAALPLILEEILGPEMSLLDDADGECTNSEGTDCKEDGAQESSDTKQLSQDYPQYTFLIGFGANDSALSDGLHSRHHVPLQEYTTNLKRMIQLIQSWNTKLNVAVAILTPPPCNTEIQSKSRDNENVTRSYANSCIQVANDMKVPVVNVWKGMQQGSEQWKIDYLSDGLHLTPSGNYRLYQLVIEMLDQSIVVANGDDEQKRDSLGVGLAVTKLPRSYPDHSMVDAEDPTKTFGTTDSR